MYWDTFPRDLSPLQRVGLASGDRRMIMAFYPVVAFLRGPLWVLASSCARGAKRCASSCSAWPAR